MTLETLLITPKANFVSGPLTQAIHLSKVLGIPLTTFIHSGYLTRAWVNYRLFKDVVTEGKRFNIIVSDLTGEQGQYNLPQCEDIYRELAKLEGQFTFLSNAPLTRYPPEWFDLFLHYFQDKDVTIMAYRTGYLQQALDSPLVIFKNLLMPYCGDVSSFPKAETLKKFEDRLFDVTVIGRRNSKSTLNEFGDALKLANPDLYVYVVDAELGLDPQDLSRYYNATKVHVGGFVWDGRGAKEVQGPSRFDWTIIEAAMHNCYLINTYLFERESRDIFGDINDASYDLIPYDRAEVMTDQVVQATSEKIRKVLAASKVETRKYMEDQLVKDANWWRVYDLECQQK